MNGFQNPVTYTSEILFSLTNEIVFAKHVSREYDDKFAHKGGQIGDTINVRRPARFTVSTGQALQPQDYFETSIPLVINNQKHIDTTFTSLDLTLKVEDFNERVVLPKIKQLANQLDQDGLQTAALVIGNAVGTPGTLPNNVSFITDAGVRLDDFSAPRDGDRYILLDQRSTSSMINALSGFFNAAGKISSQYNEAVFTDASNTLGFKFGMSQNVYRQTTGPRGGTPAVNGAGQGLTNGWSNTGTLVTNGWTAAAALRVNAGPLASWAARPKRVWRAGLPRVRSTKVFCRNCRSRPRNRPCRTWRWTSRSARAWPRPAPPACWSAGSPVADSGQSLDPRKHPPRARKIQASEHLQHHPPRHRRSRGFRRGFYRGFSPARRPRSRPPLQHPLQPGRRPWGSTPLQARCRRVPP